ncbi:hypothetical protein ROS217_12146 [Roseovarius sp. 217]|nr:hypothetical protein ROS217_12146 [Roseovarius sp. 217]
MVLSVFLVWVGGVGATNATSEPFARGAALSGAEAPEFAAWEVKTSLSQRASDDRYASDVDPILTVPPSAWESWSVSGAGWVACGSDGPVDRAHQPHSPRAPPAA